MLLGKVIALDIGTKRVGIAVSDESRQISFPRKVVTYDTTENLVETVRKLVKEEQGTLIVIGVPLDEENEDTVWSKQIRKLGEKVGLATGVEVLYIDEFLSTREAQSIIPFRKKRRERGHDDMIAAQIILDRYLGQ